MLSCHCGISEGDIFWCSLLDDVCSEFIDDFLENESLPWDKCKDLNENTIKLCLKQSLAFD